MNMEKNLCTASQVCPEGAVDLGIVITREDGTTYKLFWAKSNLSDSGLCANPEDYGNYYAWGETESKRDYEEHSYKFYNNDDIFDAEWRGKLHSGQKSSILKYNTDDDFGPVDNITELQRGEKKGEMVDDVARAKLGGKWRMPTDVEWEALLDQCDLEWTDDYNGTGVNGLIVTSKVEGYKDKSIFLPAAGYNNGCAIGYYGYYWSSSLYTGDRKPLYACDMLLWAKGKKG